MEIRVNIEGLILKVRFAFIMHDALPLVPPRKSSVQNELTFITRVRNMTNVFSILDGMSDGIASGNDLVRHQGRHNDLFMCLDMTTWETKILRLFCTESKRITVARIENTRGISLLTESVHDEVAVDFVFFKVRAKNNEHETGSHRMQDVEGSFCLVRLHTGILEEVSRKRTMQDGKMILFLQVLLQHICRRHRTHSACLPRRRKRANLC